MHVVPDLALNFVSFQYWMQVPIQSTIDQIDDVIEMGQGEGDSMTDPAEKPWTQDTWTW